MTDSEKLRIIADYINTQSWVEYDKIHSQWLRELADKLDKPERVSAEEFLYNKARELGYDNFLHYADCRSYDEIEREISKWMKEYAHQSLILPSDEEIEMHFQPNPFEFRTLHERDRIESKIMGAKWMKEQITKQQ